jgi:hypothetical protein
VTVYLIKVTSVAKHIKKAGWGDVPVLNQVPLHEGVGAEGDVTSCILNLGTGREVTGQLQDPAALLPRKEPPVPTG